MPAYEKLRANADAYRARRTDFMLARLRGGRHPDDDPESWLGYVTAPPLNVDNLVPLADRLPKWLRPPHSDFLWAAIVLMAAAVGAYASRRRRRFVAAGG